MRQALFLLIDESRQRSMGALQYSSTPCFRCSWILGLTYRQHVHSEAGLLPAVSSPKGATISDLQVSLMPWVGLSGLTH